VRPHHLPLLVLLLGADDPWADASTQDLHGYARAVSLDLRGVVPSTDELAAIEAAGTLDDTTLDAWLHSEEFVQVVVEKHRERFWNVLELTLLNSRRITRRSNIHFVSSRARTLRGLSQTHCGDFEADVDEHNRPLSWQDNADGSISEGYVWVAPYWDPDNPVQVCALDAQTALVSDSGTDCSTEDGHSDDGCGCGPSLQWCFDSREEDRIEAAIATDLDLRVRAMLESNAPYSTLFTGDNIYMDGASAHFYRHLVHFRTDDYDSPVPVSSIPDIDYASENFVAVPLPDYHAGVLTAPGWLLRHQTNRGRANRFYGGFLCSEFLPATGGESSLDAAELPTPDLQARTGCLDCHARLEPWSAYWGRWTQAGSRYLAEDTHPSFSIECAECEGSGARCSDTCDDHYITVAGHPDEEPFIGTFQPYAFLYDDKAEHPDLGPLAWVDKARADGSLAQCAVTQATDWLLHEDARTHDLEAWSAEFAADEDYRSLVRQVVTSTSYWGGAE